ncbi:family 16 glycosylhydrolase [Mycobacterium sp. NPDC006124]|uniref:family 16 glycosylhydrolase n=1 Tax=Mycobacterium sp. NPDC006124 TaxID=3156729 RepID=UPI0033BB5410
MLQFFVCEFLVVGSWRGHYSYGQNLISDLGVPYCGMQGTEPCSRSWMLMDGSVVLVGVALLTAAVLLRRPSQPLAGNFFLAVSGIGAVVVGLVPSNSLWSVHALGASLFFLFGGCYLITVGLSAWGASPAKAARSWPLLEVAPRLATVCGCVAVAGYFAFNGNWQAGLGPGGMERVTAYSVVIGFVCLMWRESLSRRTPRDDIAGRGVTRSSLANSGATRGSAVVSMVAALALVTIATGCSISRADAVIGDGAMSDDFDGADGSAPSSKVWSYDLGGGGWGNGEVQDYTNSPDNVRLDGDGHLEINAVRDGDGRFTSTRLTTKGKFAFTYGRAEARIKLPAGDGLHPAFWLLGSDIDEVGWPRAGEIDVIETVNDAAANSCTIHGPTKNGGDWQAGDGGAWPGSLSSDFHTYWVRRAPGSITMGIDDTTTCSLNADTVGAQNEWVFDKPFFLLLNIAVGGEYPGPASARTPSTSTMLVDWVRVKPS